MIFPKLHCNFLEQERLQIIRHYFLFLEAINFASLFAYDLMFFFKLLSLKINELILSSQAGIFIFFNSTPIRKY